MSHVCSLRIKILDLDALAAACTKLGLVLNKNQRTYRWYGRSVGDYPVPAGFSAADLGQCEHAIALGPEKAAELRGRYSQASYEIGVVKSKNEEGYELFWDFYNRGFGMQDVVGDEGRILKTEYGVAVATAHLESEGYEVERYIDAKTGNVMVRGAREEERRLAGY